MMKFRILVLFFMFFLCGCTRSHNNIEVIKFATWGSASEIAILKPIIKSFETNNPDIKIELLHIPQNYFQKVHLLFASNLAPDVVFMNNLNLPVYANYLIPLKVNEKSYHKQAIQALSYDDNLYAIPRDVSNLVVFYNKDLFDKAHVPYPSSNWTLKELLLTAQKLTSKKTYGISYEEDLYYLMPYILTFNESLYSVENVKNLKSVHFYKELVNKYHVAPSKADTGSKTIAQMFLEQRIAMQLSGRWLFPKYRESANFRWGVVKFPGVVPCDASGWAISKSTKHILAAEKFINFISSKDNVIKMTQSGLIIPARSDIEVSALGGDELSQKTFIDAISRSIPLKITPSYHKMKDKLNDEIFLNIP